MGPVLTELRGVLDRDPRAYEVVLVNDGSTDKTLDQMKERGLDVAGCSYH